jgi:hypothetical protein
MITLSFCVAILLIGCEGKNSSAPPNQPNGAQLTMGEGSSDSDGLNVTNGNVVLKQGQPGIAYSFSTIPGREKRFTYFLIFTYDFRNGRVMTQSSGDDLTANASHTIKAFGNDCKAEYRIELDANTKAVATESTRIAESSFDPSKGKVFLVDMKTSPPEVTQLDLELPTTIPNLEKPESAERFGSDILNQLRKANKSVDSFCLQIEADGQ